MARVPATANLSRDETAARAALVEVAGYDVVLDLTGAEDAEASTFTSTTTIRFTAEPGATTFLDLVAPAVQSITLNGVALYPAAAFDGARIVLDGLATDNEVVVVADCAYSHSGEGLHRFVDPVDGRTYLYTQFEPADARRVFANFEQPDLKAPFTFRVWAPRGWLVRSNEVGTSRRVDEATTAWDFTPTPPISTYVTSVLAGPYHLVEDEWAGGVDDVGTTVPLGVLCRASLADDLDADELLALTRAGLDFFHEVFGVAYPFGKYDQAFVPEYNLGAMENPGLVTFTERYVFQSAVTDAEHESRATTLLHEMAHMWFGDLVTMRWWDDLWLKESFADFMGTLAVAEATRFTDAWTSFANRRKAWAYRQDQLPTTHPIVADITDLEAAKLNFDGITYAKGASVLKQLVAWVGRDAFFEGATSYFRDHAWSTTTLDDFLVALEGASGRDLRAWSRGWLGTSGVDTLRVELDVDDELVVAARLVRAPSAPGVADDEPADPRPHRVAVGGYDEVHGRLQRTVRAEVDLVGESAALDELLGRPRPALVLPNDDDLTYAKVALDDTSLATARRSLAHLDRSLPRALVWSALWNATRDAQLPASLFLDVVARSGPDEDHPSVLATLHDQVRTALDHYVPAPQRARRRDHLFEVAGRAGHAAPAGSDRRLAWVRLALRLGGGRPEWLRRVLGENQTPEGVSLDTELRWTAWIELAAAGDADQDELDEALAVEETALTRRRHATALAARPTAAAKDAAWTALVDFDDLPNEMVDAVLAGWRRPDQADLTARFETPWLEQLEDLWAERSIEIARRLVTGLFPPARDAREGEVPRDHPTVVAVDDWLDEHADAPSALRRLVVEQRDHLVRSLRAQSVEHA